MDFGLTIAERIKNISKEKYDGVKYFAYTQSNKMYIKTILNTKDYTINESKHKHRDYEFIIPLSPIPCFIQNKEVCVGEVGYCYPIWTDSEHGFSSKTNNISFCTIILDYDWFNTIIDMLDVKTGPMQYFEFSQILKDLVLIFYKYFNSKFELKEKMLDSLAENIAMEIIRANREASKNIEFKTRVYHKGLQTVCDYINNNYVSDITIDELAKMSGMSKYYFISSFKDFTGCTPLSYVIKLRISKAKFYFEYTDLKIQEIAKKTGFSSTTAFSHTFARYEGLTPSQYIKTLKKIDVSFD